MHANAERVARYLADHGAACMSEHNSTIAVRELDDSARTAAEAAAAVGVPVGAIVKSLIFDADGEAVLVLASGDHQVDTTKVATQFGVAALRRATPEQVREATGFPIGGVAPVAHPAPLRTVVDIHLGDFDVVWAAAGTPHAVFPSSFDELVRLTGGTPAPVAP